MGRNMPILFCIVLQTAEGEEATDNDKYSYLYLQLFYGPQTGKFSYAF